MLVRLTVGEREKQRADQQFHQERPPDELLLQWESRRDGGDIAEIDYQQPLGRPQVQGSPAALGRPGNGRLVHLRAAPRRINCSACFNASGVTFWPDSIRPMSRVLASPVNSSSSATVRPFTSRFSTE